RSLLEVVDLTTRLAPKEHQVLCSRVRTKHREELVPVFEKLPVGHGLECIQVRKDSAFGRVARIIRQIKTPIGRCRMTIELSGAQRVQVFLEAVCDNRSSVEVARIDALVNPPATRNREAALESLDRLTRILLGDEEYLRTVPDLVAANAREAFEDAEFEWLTPDVASNEVAAEPVELFGGLDLAELEALGIIRSDDDATEPASFDATLEDIQESA